MGEVKILHQLKALFVSVYRFVVYVLRRFIRDDGMESAGFLCYATLLAMVPLLAVGLAALSTFPVFDRWSEELQSFVFHNFVPAAGEVVQKYMLEFVNKASRLTLTGIVFLMVTAILLMTNIERSLNRIWRVHRERSWRSRFLVYWTALTLGPMFIGASLGVSSYLLSLPYVSDAYAGLGGKAEMLRIAPLISSAMAFSLLYMLVPNRQVNWRHALSGGVVAAILLEFAKSGFAAYVRSFPTYDKIYGALAAIPVFLVWLYLSWVVALIGASFAAALGEPWDQKFQKRSDEPLLIKSLRVLKVISDTRKQDHSKLGDAELFSALNKAGVVDAHDVVAELIDADILGKDESGVWVLMQGLHDLTLASLSHRSCQDLLAWKAHEGDEWLIGLQNDLHSGGAVMSQVLSASVASVVNQEKKLS
ncbi:MAG: virulence factor BrkB family protein [bacterium]